MSGRRPIKCKVESGAQHNKCTVSLARLVKLDLNVATPTIAPRLAMCVSVFAFAFAFVCPLVSISPAGRPVWPWCGLAADWRASELLTSKCVSSLRKRLD